ncbi:MAG: dihydroorotate dehydrogenase-like protein [Spirochaetales bacterium]|nr:dihydroorotate dehydrogenase-like protein [Spirochaetales bacterium]
MADLKTQYMGLCLKNPVIAASSRLTGSMDSLLRCEEAGAGAVVLKSLFEEQILFDSEKMVEGTDMGVYTDAFDFLSGVSKNYYLDQYLSLLEEAKKRLSIPVIASINCIGAGVWTEYAEKMEALGADALELNMFILPSDPEQRSEDIEKKYMSTVKEIRSVLTIPMAMKISSHFTGLAGMVEALGEAGLNAVVMFNRFFRPDIDIESLKFTSGNIFSDPSEVVIPLQWIALLYGQTRVDLAASTGVHDYTGVVKNILAGANAVEICSTLFKNGIEHLGKLITGMNQWMDRHSFEKVTDFLGLLSKANLEHPEIWERSQYIKALTGIS